MCPQSSYLLKCFVSLCPQNPKAFLESYEEMLHYALKQETWPTTQQELEGRGVGKDIISTQLQRGWRIMDM